VAPLALLFLAALVTATTSVPAQSSAQQSHVEANLPDSSAFTPLLQRDLLDYFRKNGVPGATEVNAELLRKEPTQSGASYPKFYAWVTVKNQDKVVAQGAVRVAAVARTGFEVTDFIPKEAARRDRSLLEAVFPRSLIPSIQERAAL
jgi:hypothetical protein